MKKSMLCVAMVATWCVPGPVDAAWRIVDVVLSEQVGPTGMAGVDVPPVAGVREIVREAERWRFEVEAFPSVEFRAACNTPVWRGDSCEPSALYAWTVDVVADEPTRLAFDLSGEQTRLTLIQAGVTRGWGSSFSRYVNGSEFDPLAPPLEVPAGSFRLLGSLRMGAARADYGDLHVMIEPLRAVPEPATATLCVGVLAVLLGVRRGRHRALS